MKNINSEIATRIAIKSQVLSGEATAVNGYTIDTYTYGAEGALLAVALGDTTGTPTRFGTTFHVEESEDGVTFTDVTDLSITFSGESVANQSRLSGEIYVDLKPLDRYIRAVVTPTFTAGSSPKVNAGAVWVFGEAKVKPI